MNDTYQEQIEKEIKESRSFTYKIRKKLIKMGLLTPNKHDINNLFD